LICFLNLLHRRAALLRSVVGVAGGATKAAISNHQARQHNIGDVLAKDGSQETAVGLIGLLLSLLVTPLVAASPTRRWLFFTLFTTLHLYCNYRAVYCVEFDSLNRQRMTKLMRRAHLTPRAMTKLETFVLPWHDIAIRSVLNGGDIILGLFCKSKLKQCFILKLLVIGSSLKPLIDQSIDSDQWQNWRSVLLKRKYNFFITQKGKVDIERKCFFFFFFC
jgi:hypothetical protein